MLEPRRSIARSSTLTMARHSRFAPAGVVSQPGWVGGQLLKPDGDPGRRIIVGTWRSRDDWRAWHTAPDFQATRAKLDTLVRGPEAHAWHDVVVEIEASARGAAGAGRAT